MRHERMLPTSRLFTMILPLVGWISRNSNLTIVDLPEPDGPMKKTNSPFSIATDTSLRDGRWALGYVFVTCSSAITGRKSTRCNENANTRRGGRRDLPKKIGPTDQHCTTGACRISNAALGKP